MTKLPKWVILAIAAAASILVMALAAPAASHAATVDVTNTQQLNNLGGLQPTQARDAVIQLQAEINDLKAQVGQLQLQNQVLQQKLANQPVQGIQAPASNDAALEQRVSVLESKYQKLAEDLFWLAQQVFGIAKKIGFKIQ